MKIRGFHITTYLFIAILIIAALLRLKCINQPLVDAFSWRQSSTAMMADNFYRRNWNIFYPEVNWIGPGPGYQGREFQTVSYISALLYIVAGQYDWVGRGVAVLFGLWGIFALYKLVKRVWDKEHALISAAVMAVLPGSIFIERSFLPDPAMVALVVTSFWLLVVYLQTGRWPYLLLASLIGAWGFLTKIPGLIVGLPMAYTMLTILGRQRILKAKTLVALGLFALLALIPVIAYYLWARHLALSYPPYHFAGGGANWLWNAGLEQWLSYDYFLPDLRHHFTIWLWTPPVIMLALIGLPFRPRRAAARREIVNDQGVINGSVQAPWLFHWWLLAGVIYYLMGAKELVGNPWNFHIINPAAAALVGHTILLIGSFTARSLRWPLALFTTTILLLLIIGMVGQIGLRWMYKSYAKESYQLGLALREIALPDDLVVTVANDIGDPVAIYYSQRRGWVFPPAEPEKAWDYLPDDDEAIRLFEELCTQGADWLGIVNEHYNELLENNPKFMKHIERTCELKQESSKWVIYHILTSEDVTK
jgi:4-amino-4-deoxy-L-arabinose transferase-like glycosyltransferase